MPIIVPIIVGALIGGAVGWGIGEGLDGYDKIKEAKDIVNKAKNKFDKKKRKIKKIKNEVNQTLEEYKMVIIQGVNLIGEVIELLKSLQLKIKEREWKELLSEIEISYKDLETLYRFPEVLKSLSEGLGKELGKGAISSIVAGIGTYSSAVWLVSLFGTASTGTAISSLSGAAATNAILAWFGGGALAAGGGGIALGSLVLGGITVAPAFVIGGIILSRQGEKALKQALEFQKEVKDKLKDLMIIEKSILQIRDRTEQMCEIINELIERLDSYKNKLINIVSNQKQYKRAKIKINASQKKTIQICILLAYGLKEIIQTPIFDKQGKVTTESAEVIVKSKKILGEVKNEQNKKYRKSCKENRNKVRKKASKKRNS